MPLSNSSRPTSPMSSWRASGISMTGSPEWLGVATSRLHSRSSTRAVLLWICWRSWSPRRALTSRPDRTVASEAHQAVAALAVRAQLVVAALADHAEPVGVVDAQQRVVLAGDAGEGRQV